MLARFFLRNAMWIIVIVLGFGLGMILLAYGILSFFAEIMYIPVKEKVERMERIIEEKEEDDFFSDLFEEPIHGKFVNGEKDSFRSIRRGARRGIAGRDMTPMKRVTRKK
jgi:sensor histidine kinase YesM